MALTLLVENNPKIVEIYQINLTTYVGLDIMVVTNLDDALQAIEKQPFQLIITRARIQGQEVAVPLAEKMLALQLKAPLFVIGHGIYPKLAQSTLSGSLDLKGVVKGSAQALGITAQQMAEKKVDNYFPLHRNFFHSVRYPCCDLYGKMENGNFDLIAGAQKAVNPDQIKSFEYIYVQKFDRLKIVNQITAELISQLNDEDLNPDEQLQAQSSNLELLSQKLVTLGINEETINLAKKGMAKMAENAKKHKELGKLLQRMLKNQTGYLFRHTQIVTYVSLHIVRHIDWGTPEQEEKIGFVSFFHDIVLETDEQAKIKNKEELRKSRLDTREKALVEKHAQLAAELVHKYPHAPMGADQIIRQHHGMLNGIGFSDHFGANLSPMAIVFVVAEEFTRIILERGEGPFDVKDMLKELKHSFPTTRFQKMIEILERISF